MKLRRNYSQGLIGALATSKSMKGGNRIGDKAAETGSRRRDAWAKRDLGGRSRAAIQRVQGRAVEAGRSKHLCEQAIQDRNIRGITGS